MANAGGMEGQAEEKAAQAVTDALLALRQRSPGQAMASLQGLQSSSGALPSAARLIWLETQAQLGEAAQARAWLQAQATLTPVESALLRHFQADGAEDAGQTLAAEPDRIDAARQALIAQIDAGNALDSWPGVLDACRQSPLQPLSWKMLALVSESLQMPHLAQAAWQRAVRLAPQDAWAWSRLGTLLYQQRRLPEARQCLQAACLFAPGEAGFHLLHGNALRDMGLPVDAETAFRQALRCAPQSIDVLNNLGNLLRQRWQLPEAEKRLRLAMALDPRRATTCNNLACVLRDQGRLVDAEQLFRLAGELAPTLPEVGHNLVEVLLQQERFDQAETALNAALARQPDDAVSCRQFSLLMQRLDRAKEALAVYQKALAGYPPTPDLLTDLGTLLLDLGQYPLAERSLRQALLLDRTHLRAHQFLAIVMRKQGRAADAAVVLRHAQALRPDDIDTLENLGMVLGDLGQTDEAEQCLRAALARDPAGPRKLINLADLLFSVGRMDEATSLAERALAVAPTEPGIVAAVMFMLPLRADDPRLAHLSRLRAELPKWPLAERIMFHLAWGKAWEKAGDYEQAFACYDQGNRLRAGLMPYDEASAQAQIDRLGQPFTPSMWRAWARPAASPARRVPVFIVGMPRSGSSLVEQMLAAHPAVHGGGELTLMQQFVEPALAILNGPPDEAQIARLHALGQDYLDQLWRLAPSAQVICDKMLSNYLYLGLIGLMLPEARIVHCARSPMDTCFSCFTTSFLTGHEECFDQVGVARHFLLYRRLMRHWQQVMPGRVLTVAYERVVQQPEEEVRRLLDAIGLPWDPACLQFHSTGRRVRTASMTQVRQPLYRHAMQRWQHFAPWLGDMHAVLAEEEAAWQRMLVETH
ncbi:MAG: sulfotransferase [Paludibacterium sp.]|uniref:tetratricopeptide repeat-containing sulfotransferase family protein n=1 Tax=Paludibacterium sp. TaxID=1917523 RepID=UPI0025E4EF9E|nr:tetratricopeptide repeat-containing sulfotransferase family protein [Paludibacterium sp.]MBV8047157.1 sulfotransferase [Paludibacterium sp.]MBV8647736.1 sulfotransferase [Paludibacterium sp.]